MLRGSLIASCLATTLLASPVGAEPLPGGPDLARSGWKTWSFPGIASTDFSGLADGGIVVSANKSSALLYRPLPKSGRSYRSLAWKWRVDQPIPATDLTRKGGDDRPLALHIWFPEVEEETGLFDRIGDFITKDVAGLPEAGKILTYVWGGQQAPGESFVNPYTGAKGRMIVLRSDDAECGRWYRERIDFAADYRRLFGHRAPAPMYIALSADSDHTGGHSVGQISELRLLSQ